MKKLVSLRDLNAKRPVLWMPIRSFASENSVKEGDEIIKRDPEIIKKEYEELFEYARGNLAYKCGNLTDMPSRFGYFKRWRLENQINYNNAKHPIFLYAYRAFIDALAS
jgi:hypothetical protein